MILRSITKSFDIIVKGDDDTAMHYPGGKAKCFHHVVNLIPPHKVYIEPFLGFGSVMRAKKRSDLEIGIDLDSKAISFCTKHSPKAHLHQSNGVSFIQNFEFTGEEVIYCDPPYLAETRKRHRVYKYDFTTEDHAQLLDTLTKVDANVLISGYASNLYHTHLKTWNTYTFTAKAHDGLREEVIWFNFPPPSKLHDYRYLGNTFRERQNIQRKLARLQAKIADLEPCERACLRDWLSDGGLKNAT